MEELLKDNPFLDNDVTTKKELYKYCLSLFIEQSGGIQKAFNKLSAAYIAGKLTKSQYYQLKYCMLRK
jgi:hypothetical protein